MADRRPSRYISRMCGRFTTRITWAEIVALYRLKEAVLPHRPRWLANPHGRRIWSSWKNRETGQQLLSCTMLITEPNEFVSQVHYRMPVLLTEKQFKPWLTGEAGVEYLKPAGNDLLLQMWPVSKRVNSSNEPADDPTLIDRVAV